MPMQLPKHSHLKKQNNIISNEHKEKKQQCDVQRPNQSIGSGTCYIWIMKPWTIQVSFHVFQLSLHLPAVAPMTAGTPSPDIASRCQGRKGAVGGLKRKHRSVQQRRLTAMLRMAPSNHWAILETTDDLSWV